jgi:hypothetical protein
MGVIDQAPSNFQRNNGRFKAIVSLGPCAPQKMDVGPQQETGADGQRSSPQKPFSAQARKYRCITALAEKSGH